jgi:hypothetical protein
MNLEDVYSRHVPRSSISNFSVGGDYPQIERDPTIRALERDVFAQLAAVIPQEVVAESPPSLEVQAVSYEDAIRELIAMSKQ